MEHFSERSLVGRRVLVVEDEPLLAMDLSEELELAAAIVVGPAGTLDAALDLARESQLDAAVLDISLHGELVFPVADVLTARGVPFLFATGYDRAVVPSSYARVPTCSKTGRAGRVLEVLAKLARTPN